MCLTLLSDNSSDNSAWPAELIQLKDKFTADSQQEIMRLKAVHENEITKLRNDYEKQLNRKMQRNTTFDKNRDLGEVIKERNGLRKLNKTLRSLITELIGYVSECETELNNTLWSNLDHAVQLCDNTIADDSILQNVSNPDLNASAVSVKTSSRHVHFAPDISQFLDQLHDDSVLRDILDPDLDLTSELKTELNHCLDRLRTEASALLQLTSGVREGADTIRGPSKDEGEGETGGRLEGLLGHVGELEKDKQDLIAELIEVQKERDALKVQLVESATRYDKHEIVSEGYGGHSPVRNPLAKHSTFSELRQRATALLSAPPHTTTVNTPLLQLFEDLCREGDRIYEEANQDRDDLQLQIEAADKQLRSTRQFLEDQAAEREQERDDFTREICELKERLRERDRERHGHETALSELEQDVVRKTVEHLENQMRDMSAAITRGESRKQELESELKASVDKICLLGDIIRELENQLEARAASEERQARHIVDLQEANEEQHRSYEALTKELLTAQHDADVRALNEKIGNLEDQLHSHRRSTENADAVMEVRKQIEEIGTCIDLKTKLLESVHAAVYSTSCSSEDVSLRDRKLPVQDDQPDRPCAGEETSPAAALDHLLQVQEKLQRHSKAEEATLKRIRDLDMQIQTLKHTCTELRNERDILQERSQQQIMDLSSLQSRLDDQRRRADSINKQSTSELHLQIHNLQSDLTTAQEQLVNKNRRILNLEQIVEESRQRLIENQTGVFDKDASEAIGQLHQELDALRKENKELRDKVKTDRINKIALPDLMDTMLEEKNADIDMLKERLEKVTKDLDRYLELRLTEEEMKELKVLKDKKDLQDGAKLSARTLSDIVSISDYDEIDVLRKNESRFESTQMPSSLLVNSNKPDLMGSPPFSFTGFNLASQDDIQFRSLPLGKDTFEDLKDTKPDFFQNDTSPRLPHHKLDLIPENEECSVSDAFPGQNNEVDDLRNQLEEKSAKLTECEKQLSCLPILEKEIEDLRFNLHETLMAVEEDKVRFETLISSENELKQEMQRMKIDLLEKSDEIANLKNCLLKKDDQLEALAGERLDLLKKIENIADSEHRSMEQEKENAYLKSKVEELSVLDSELARNKNEMDGLQKVLSEKNQELLTLRDYTELLKNTIKEKSDSLNTVNKEMQDQMMKISEQNDCIEKLTRDLSRLRSQQEDAMESRNRHAEEAYQKDIKERDDEILHFKELLHEKEKIIDHMSEDSDNLHTALATIQSKLRESGNVLDLAMKLKEELKKNELLGIEVEHLRNTLSRLELNSSPQPIDEIAEQVQKELDVSAKLDNSLIQAIESDDFASDDDQKVGDGRLAELLSENEMLQMKLDEEIKRNIKLMASKQSLLIDLKNCEDKLKSEEGNNMELHLRLQNEIARSNEMQLQDANIMEAMRMRLEKALDKETSLQNLLEDERNNRKSLETKNKSLNKDFEPLDDEFVHDQLMPEAKRLRKDLEIQVEINDRLTSEIMLLKAQIDLEKGKLVDAQRSLEKERAQYSEDLDAKLELIGDLKHDLERLREQKNRLSRELYEANQRSVQQRDRIANLECRIKTLQSSETKRNQRKDKDKQEQLATALKHQELQTQTSGLESRLVSLQNELDRAVEREVALRDALNVKQDSDPSSGVNAQFLNKLKEMSTMLEQYVLTNKQFALLGENNKLDSLEHVNAESYQNALDRANHVYGKYLRCESYRKALTWQKNYLLLVQQSYETAEKKALNRMQLKPNKRNVSPRERFRIAVLAVVAVSRMQFLVRRWQVGKMIGGRIASSNQNHKKRHSNAVHNVWNTPQSPPCRDRDKPNRLLKDRNLDTYTKYESHDRLSQMSPDIHKYL